MIFSNIADYQSCIAHYRAYSSIYLQYSDCLCLFIEYGLAVNTDEYEISAQNLRP